MLPDRVLQLSKTRPTGYGFVWNQSGEDAFIKRREIDHP